MTSEHRAGRGVPWPARCGPAGSLPAGARQAGALGHVSPLLDVPSERPTTTPTTSVPHRPALPAALVVAGLCTALAVLLVGNAGALALLGTEPGGRAGFGLSGTGGPVPVAASAGIEPEAPPPRSVRIERLGIDSTLVNLGVQPDGTLEVPEEFGRAGWHRGGTAPGNAGPAVLVGHVDSYEGPAVFFRLRELQAGDLVHVTRIDGSQVVFEVYALETVPKDQFPTDRVYGPTEAAELRLLTCGGAFDQASRSYADNVVAYARLVPGPVAS